MRVFSSSNRVFFRINDFRALALQKEGGNFLFAQVGLEIKLESGHCLDGVNFGWSGGKVLSSQSNINIMVRFLQASSLLKKIIR